MHFSDFQSRVVLSFGEAASRPSRPAVDQSREASRREAFRNFRLDRLNITGASRGASIETLSAPAKLLTRQEMSLPPL